MKHGTMCCCAPSKVMPFHQACKAFPLAHPGHIHFILGRKLVDQYFGSNLCLFGRIREPEFPEKPHWRNIPLFEMTGHGFVYPSSGDEFDQTQLDSVVSIIGSRFLLNHETGSRLNDGGRNDHSIFTK